MPPAPVPSSLYVRLDRAEPLSAAATALHWRSGGAPETGWELPLTDWFRLVQRVSREAADESCRMSARPLALGATDFMVDTMRAADTLEDAMRRVARGYNLMHGGAYNRVERRPGRLVYVIDDRTFPYAPTLPAEAAHTLIEGMQIFLHAMLSLGVGSGVELRESRVCTRRSGRGAPDGALAFWRAPVRRGASAYALEYADSLADVPIRARAAITGDDVYDAAVGLVMARAQAPAPSFLDRCLDAVAAGVRDQPAVAHSLGVSPATLRRRLEQAGVTFRELRGRAQGESARTLLAAGEGLTDVAERLGFSDVRSFSRAFKARYGVTPAAFARRG